MTDALLSERTADGASAFVSPDEIRTRFSSALSRMYRAEVPQYGTLLDLVAQVNAQALAREPALLAGGAAEAARLDIERHGAIRVGTPQELRMLRRVFAVMGMQPVGYYDLAAAGVPVHATAFRPVAERSLAANPFRVFTSLLRLELIQDPALRQLAAQVLGRRRIFSARALALTARFETAGGLAHGEADEFVRELLPTFRWHDEASVSRDTYQRLRAAHPLLADVVCFKGPHINHLTPRTLDIDAAQREMPRRGISAKESIEGPPRRKVPILLRQTSFKALEEPVRFAADASAGAHTARFGEIEQRGIALTRKGRVLYDSLLQRARAADGHSPGTALARAFEAFPDDLDTLRRQGLGLFRYALRSPAQAHIADGTGIDALVDRGIVDAVPITYEDFLPVSAAGIFQSNLGDAAAQASSAGAASQHAFEEALGVPVLDEIALGEAQQAASIARVMRQLALGPAE